MDLLHGRGGGGGGRLIRSFTVMAKRQAATSLQKGSCRFNSCKGAVGTFSEHLRVIIDEKKYLSLIRNDYVNIVAPYLS